MAASLSGLTKVNGVGTSTQVYIFDDTMTQVDSFMSNGDGTFTTLNVIITNEYYIVATSATGQCPEISGLLSPIEI